MKGSWARVVFCVTMSLVDGYSFFAWHSPLRWVGFVLALACALAATYELNHIQGYEDRRAEEQRRRDEREWGHR